jgi:hypothetical protein
MGHTKRVIQGANHIRRHRPYPQREFSVWALWDAGVAGNGALVGPVRVAASRGGSASGVVVPFAASVPLKEELQNADG